YAKGEGADYYNPSSTPGRPQTLPGIKLRSPIHFWIKEIEGTLMAKILGSSAEKQTSLSESWAWLVFGAILSAIACAIWKFQRCWTTEQTSSPRMKWAKPPRTGREGMVTRKSWNFCDPEWGRDGDLPCCYDRSSPMDELKMNIYAPSDWPGGRARDF
ncbi:MAG: hypothetical protein ABI162_16435, partial [Luteolibacter sp.]